MEEEKLRDVAMTAAELIRRNLATDFGDLQVAVMIGGPGGFLIGSCGMHESDVLRMCLHTGAHIADRIQLGSGT